MKIPRKYKLEKAVSSDNIRPAMNCIRIKNNVAAATDGHILAEVPVEGYDGELFISKDEWKFIQQYGKIKDPITKKLESDYEFEVNDNNICTMNKRFLAVRNKITETYPNTDSIKPKAEDRIEYDICFNPWLLMNLVRAMGISRDESIQLKFYGRTKSIVVKPNIYSDEKEYGLLMPVRSA